MVTLNIRNHALRRSFMAQRTGSMLCCFSSQEIGLNVRKISFSETDFVTIIKYLRKKQKIRTAPKVRGNEYFI